MQFKPDPDTVRELEANLNGNLPNDKHLAPLQSTDRNLDQIFICKVCTQVVENPRECQQCSNLFCSDCISAWQSELM